MFDMHKGATISEYFSILIGFSIIGIIIYAILTGMVYIIGGIVEMFSVMM